MKRKGILSAVYVVVAVTMATGCIAPQVHNALKTEAEVLRQENEAHKLREEKGQTSLSECKSALHRVQNAFSSLQSDTIAMNVRLRTVQRDLDDMTKNYDYLLKNNSSLNSANLRENKAVLARFEALKADVEAKEDSLKREQDRLNALGIALQARERRVYELEKQIARKDSVVKAIQKSVADALLGFQGKGLTVTMRGGKVYVSLDNSLLFTSGSWTVQDKGRLALERLAKVLAANKDVRIEIEGHTDNDAFRGASQVVDNWDLSVMRATSVTKIIAGKGVDPSRISAVGRGEFAPLALNDTPENKGKNRRTEIIISPKLDELARLIDGL